MSNNIDNEYFCDGITEELINALTKINGLKVIARTSSFAFKNHNIDIRHIGNQLGVTSVIEGSIRISGKRIRITAQLIDTRDGTHYWSKNFDRELIDIFKLQDEITLLIANEIRNNFGHLEIQDHLVKESTNSIEAYELFLKGRYCQLKWTPESMRLAIQHYDEAIILDKNYAKAYYANLQCYGLLSTWGYMPYEIGLELAISNFLKAKEIDKQLPEYPLSYVGQAFWRDWDFKSTYDYIKQVLAINPNHIDGLEAMAELFIANGFFKKAIVYANKLLELDPLSANNHYTLAHIYYFKKKYKLALESIRKAISINPDLELAHHIHVLCLVGLKQKDKFEEVIKNQDCYELQSLLYKVVNENVNVPEDKIKTWTKLEKQSTQLMPYQLFILANSKHKTKAFALLKEYIEQRRGQIINYRQEPLLKELQNFPEFKNLHQSNLFISDSDTLTKVYTDSKVLLNKEEQQIFKGKLLNYFEENKPYLDSQLSLNRVAKHIEIHPNKLSYLINEIMEVNFNEFINQYRLKHFKIIALDLKFKNITILGLAYDSGFNSKTVFNTFFKKEIGLTPKQWVKSQS